MISSTISFSMVISTCEKNGYWESAFIFLLVDMPPPLEVDPKRSVSIEISIYIQFISRRIIINNRRYCRLNTPQ